MRLLRALQFHIAASLLILSGFSAAPGSAATPEGVPEPISGVVPATAPAPGADPCLNALQAAATEAERICSDQIAGLRYEGAAGRASAALPSALNNRAMARMNAGDTEGAAADLTEALELAPGAWALYLNRARLALMNGDAGAALDDLGQVRELTPSGSAADMGADRTAVLAWRMRGNLGAAENLLRQTIAQERAIARERASEPGSSNSFSPERQAPAEPGPPPG